MQRDRLRIPYSALMGVVRFSIDEIFRWEMANSTPGFEPQPVAQKLDAVEGEQVDGDESAIPERSDAPRWHTLVRE